MKVNFGELWKTPMLIDYSKHQPTRGDEDDDSVGVSVVSSLGDQFNEEMENNAYNF